jgi:TRAP-type C4-dicarboxylate transport system permease small subunit
VTDTTRAQAARPGPVAGFLRQPPPWLALASRAVTFVELALGALAVLFIFFLVLLQAGQRYLPIDGWSWTGELARFSLVWLTFVVAGVLVSRDGHVSIEMVDSIPNRLVVRVARVVSSLIVAAVGVGLTAAAWELTQTQGGITSPALRMPMSWFYAISLIGFVSTTIRAVIAAVSFAVLGVPERDTTEALAAATRVAVE